MMALLLTLYPTRFLACGCGVCVVPQFFKGSNIPAVDSKLDSCANLFGAINGLCTFQDDRLKKYHPLGVPLLTLYAVKIH